MPSDAPLRSTRAMGFWVITLAFTAGALMGIGIERRWVATYRHWYLMCRNALEAISLDGNPALNQRIAKDVLAKIGPRMSKREDWENA